MKYKVSLLILFAITAALLFVANSQHYRDSTELYLHDTTERTLSEYTAMVESYKLMTQTFISEAIMQPDVLRIYREAHQADSAKQDLIREELRMRLTDNYISLKANNIRQLHFHLPDNTSFLRFHRPDKYGDDLSNVRYSVMMTNLKKKPHFGFEEGRIYNGFRNVYPLILEDEHIGSVEISFAINALKNYSLTDSTAVYNLLIKEEAVLSKVFESEQDNYARSPLLDGFVYEPSDHIHISDHRELIKTLNEKASLIRTNIENNEHFTIIHKAEEGHFTATFLNIRNVEQTPVAYLFTFQPDNKLSELEEQYHRSVLFDAIALLIIFFLLYYLLVKIETMKQKDMKLIRSEKRYQRIIDRMTDVYFRTDLDQNLIMLSPSGASNLGYDSVSQMLGKNIPDTFFMNPEDGSRLLQALDANNGEIRNFEVILKTRSGEAVAFETNSQFIYDQNGDRSGVEGILRNVSVQKQAQKKIQEYTHELEVANSTKNTFFSIIAHDLKNPFMAILGLTELLKLNFNSYSREQVREMIALIDSSGKNTYKLLEQLLDWSRIQTGHIQFEPDHHEIEPVIDEVFRYYENAANCKKISLISSIHSQSEPVTVYADRNLFSTIVRNLVSNAIKFTPEGGQVMVEVNQTFIETILSVSDTGTGIPDNIKGRLFKIEEKVSTSGTNNEHGTGLGLLLVKEFIEIHDGTIQIQSTPGRGSRFTIVIPHKFEAYSEVMESDAEKEAIAV